MRAIIQLYMFFMYFLFVVVTCADKNESVFVPSREWQIVKKGTPIPRGLHVRHNFKTGVTEAKLMDDDETKDEYLLEYQIDPRLEPVILHPDKALPESEDDESIVSTKESKHLKLSIEELKARLKKIKAGEADLPSEINDESRQAKVMQKFKSYEALKEELKDFEASVTTDAEVLTTLFKKFQAYKNALSTSTLTTAEIENVLDILNNLEYLSHQIDNADLFAKMEGITNIISPCLNSTYHEVKAEALRLLGTAVQSNPKVQGKALESDLVQKLLHILSTKSKTIVKSRCLFALSALVRQFPVAQKALIDRGGLEIFGKILNSNQLQIQVKVMKLINDLIIERKYIKKVPNDESDVKVIHYAYTNFETKLRMHGYCKHLNNLMMKSFMHELNNHDIENYELLEVISESMITTSPLCKDELQNNKKLLLEVTNAMLYLCQGLMESVNSDDSETILNQIQLLLKLKAIVVKIPSHIEL